MDYTKNINFEESLFNIDGSVDLCVYVTKFSPDQNVKIFDVATDLEMPLLFESILSRPFRPEYNGDYITSMRTIIGEYTELLNFKSRDLVGQFEKLIGLNEYPTTVALLNQNPLIKDSAGIGGYGFLTVEDFKQNTWNLENLKDFDCIMVTLTRNKLRDETINFRLPLVHAIFLVPKKRLNADTFVLSGLWLSTYGQFRYKKQNMTFPKGLGLNILKISIDYIYRWYEIPFKYIGLHALYNTRKMLERKKIPLYRYTNDVMDNIDYDEEEKEGGLSVIHPENEQPNPVSVEYLKVLEDIHYITVEDVNKAGRKTQIRCKMCNREAKFVCIDCKMVYCSQKCLFPMVQ